MLLGNFFIPLSLTLTLVLGHKVSAKLHFLTHFLTDWDEIGCGVEAVQAEHPDTIFD